MAALSARGISISCRSHARRPGRVPRAAGRPADVDVVIADTPPRLPAQLREAVGDPLRGNSGQTICARGRASGHRPVRALRHRRLAAGVAADVPPGQPSIRRARPRRDRSGHCARAHVRGPRTRPCPAGGPGPKGDLNDWLRVGARGDPAAFRSVLERALAASPIPWALQIQGLPSDLAPWDLEDHAGVRDLLCEIGHQGPLSRDAHLRLLAERCGVALATLQEAAREVAQSAETES